MLCIFLIKTAALVPLNQKMVVPEANRQYGENDGQPPHHSMRGNCWVSWRRSGSGSSLIWFPSVVTLFYLPGQYELDDHTDRYVLF